MYVLHPPMLVIKWNTIAVDYYYMHAYASNCIPLSIDNTIYCASATFWAEKSPSMAAKMQIIMATIMLLYINNIDFSEKYYLYLKVKHIILMWVLLSIEICIYWNKISVVFIYRKSVVYNEINFCVLIM